MRWLWIDRVVELVPGERMVAIKNVSLAEDHLHDHFPAVVGAGGEIVQLAMPVMPASLIIEGMAQTAGILVGHAEDFREKVVLAKISRVELSREVGPGFTLRYTAVIERMDAMGAATSGTVELIDPGSDAKPEIIGHIDLMFSHLDQSGAGMAGAGMAGMEYPEHNFIFGESFKTVLRSSGIAVP